LPPTSGCSPTRSHRIEKARSSSSTPPSGSSPAQEPGYEECELSLEDIERICHHFLDFKETPESKIFPNQAFGYWKVTVERPLRLKSQFSLKAIESLRFASGDEDLRNQLYEEFGDDLSPTSVRVRSLWEAPRRLGSDEEEDDAEEDSSLKKGLSEKLKKKLLDQKTWERDGHLVEVATVLRKELGDNLFEDYNVFCGRVEKVLKKRGLKLPAADLKQILKQ